MLRRRHNKAVSIKRHYRDHRQHANIYQIISLYDRVTDSTRISAVLLTGVTWFKSGGGARVWLTASFSFPGRRLAAAPDSVELSFDSFTQEGGGWAFSQKRPLRVEVGNSVRLEVPPTVYQRLGRSLLDRGRREVMSFRIPVHQFINLADEPEIVLHTGRARFELSSHAMEMLRDLIRRMTQP